MGVKRAEAARQLNVSRARITQYVQAGMPSEPDGSIDVQAARSWLEQNLDPSRREGWALAKALRPAAPHRPRRLTKEEAARQAALAKFDPFRTLQDFDGREHRMFAYAVVHVMYTLPAYAVLAAADAGVSRDQARAAAELLTLLVWENLEDAAQAIGIEAPDGRDGIFALERDLLDFQLRGALDGGSFDASGVSLVTGLSRVT